MGVEVVEFHDNLSTSQNENLNTIVNYHNSQKRDLDISVHFNAYQPTEGPRGTECLYLTQHDLAARVSKGVAEAGLLTDRGAKKRTDLFFLNNTAEPAILIEVCFVDSEADVDCYHTHFDEICDAIALSVGGPTS
jgi:N-acetylmuramoyl-L-alanine amidase